MQRHGIKPEFLNEGEEEGWWGGKWGVGERRASISTIVLYSISGIHVVFFHSIFTILCIFRNNAKKSY